MRTSRRIALLVFAASIASAQQNAFKLVVHGSNGVTTLTQDEATQFFLKKKTAWPGGATVQPVDQQDTSPTRRAFSKTVLKRDVAAVKSYWQTQIFSGRGVPPPELSSDAEVLAYVESHAGALGYVAAGTQLTRAVKEVTLD